MNRDLILTFTIRNVIIGIVVGLLFGLFHFKLVEHNIKSIIRHNETVDALTTILSVSHTLVFAAPLLLACLYPEVLNLFATAFGLTLPKLYIILTNIFFRKN